VVACKPMWQSTKHAVLGTKRSATILAHTLMLNCLCYFSYNSRIKCFRTWTLCAPGAQSLSAPFSYLRSMSNDLERCGTKRSWPVFCYYVGTCKERQREITKHSSEDRRSEGLHGMQECYLLDSAFLRVNMKPRRDATAKRQRNKQRSPFGSLTAEQSVMS
jgi:hypothetical protein